MFESERVQRALDFATQKHKGQKRIGGEDYITHPIAVYEMVKAQGYGEDFQITALFHDLLEDTNTTEEELLAYGNQNVQKVLFVLLARCTSRIRLPDLHGHIRDCGYDPLRHGLCGELPQIHHSIHAHRAGTPGWRSSDPR